MHEVVSYFVGRSGKLWVCLESGAIRRATDDEWLKIWSSDPNVTLALAA